MQIIPRLPPGAEEGLVKLSACELESAASDSCWRIFEYRVSLINTNNRSGYAYVRKTTLRACVHVHVLPLDDIESGFGSLWQNKLWSNHFRPLQSLATNCSSHVHQPLQTHYGHKRRRKYDDEIVESLSITLLEFHGYGYYKI